ncbi:eukaryotic-type DNA primase, large subunit [Ostreococcus tauri]|uniref:Eukaryotic-type DNA primase, large subunit n=1 Tax=Ostreococcus tauri TaxID=70448 RepID=A0A1Y5I5V0_OSTTA|nr:eukaryotic-type DNA primase, large subunit [Ostreococcus tauri]
MPSAFGVLKSANAVAQERARSKYTGNAARLDAYATPPTEERSIDYLERCASDRYALLRAIDDARSGGKKDGELKKVIREEEERREMRRTNGRGEFDEENASRDATGHFLLRLASSLKEEHERWFVENELELFKYRFGELSESGKESFMKTNGFDDYGAASERDVQEHKNELRDVLMADFEFRKALKDASVNNLKLGEFERKCAEEARNAKNWFVVGFEEVSPLVRTRRAYLIGGRAWIRKETLDQLVFGRFRARLSLGMKKAKELFKQFEVAEANRLAPLLRAVHNKRSGRAYEYQGEEGTMSISGIEQTQDSFPLCMRQLHNALKKKHHLTHGGRRQYQLYLKGIGLPLDQALVFWKTEFTKSPDCSAEKFEKDYSYGIRHAYGREGKRVNYTPHSCGQCINATPGEKDSHGCPFRTMTSGGNKNGEALHELLTKSMKIPEDASIKIVDKAKGMHYQIACGMTFAALHDGKEIEAGVHTPHQYFHESRKIIAPAPGEAAVATATTAA